MESFLKNFLKVPFLWCWDQINKMPCTKCWPLTPCLLISCSYVWVHPATPLKWNVKFSIKNKNWHSPPSKGESIEFWFDFLGPEWFECGPSNSCSYTAEEMLHCSSSLEWPSQDWLFENYFSCQHQCKV